MRQEKNKKEKVAALEAVELVKRFGPVTALNGISFSVEDGELFGFLGPNGAGKTTTIRIFMNLTRPTSGEARIFGLDSVQDSLEVKSLVGIVPDISNIFPEISTLSNLLFTGSLYGLGRKERRSRAEELLETFTLSEHADKKAGQLSHGLKRRLAIAMSIVHSPKVVFLDEPTSGLDVSSARGIRNLVNSLKATGTTFFLTTHNMEEANELSDRIAVINQGNIIAIDTPERLKREAVESQVLLVEFNRTLNEEEKKELASTSHLSDVCMENNSYKFHTGNPESAIDSIVQFASKHGLKIRLINTLGPSLEDVFLRLTGEEARIGRNR